MLAARVVGVTLLVLLTLPALALAPPSDVSGTLNFSGIDDAANEAVASGEIPGVVVLIGRRDDILLQRAYGSRRLVPNQVPMTLDTIFDIASLTKPVGTTIAVMSLVERRPISLDAPLGRYLREFQGKQFDEITIRTPHSQRRARGISCRDSAVAAGFPDGGAKDRQAAARVCPRLRLPVQRHRVHPPR